MANQKTTELTADTAPVDADLVMTVDDVAGTPTNKKVTLANLAAGAPFSSRYQPVDSDLTAIAALTTTAFGRALLALADAAAGRTALGLGTAATSASGDFQPVDSDLTAIAALTTTAYGRSVLEAANAAALRSLAGVVIGTDVQAYDADLAAIAALTSAADKLAYATGAGTWALTDFTAAGRALVDDASASAQRTTLGLGTAAVVNTGTAAGNVPLNSDLRTFSAGTRTTPDTATAGDINIDVSLSGGIAGGDTLNGGSAASETLTLGSTSHSTRGTISLRDRTLLISEDKTYNASTGPSLLQVASARTLTLSSATGSANGVRAFDFSPTVVWGAAAATSASYLFANAGIWKSDTSSRTVLALQSFYAAPTVRADTGTLTITALGGAAVTATLDRINSGTLVISAYAGFQSSLTVGAGCTVTDLRHVAIVDAANSGTVTDQYGVYIPALAGGTNNYGLFNSSTTVYNPGASTMSAASSTVRTDRTHVRLNNTSGGSLTLTGTPTIADGPTGQIIHMVNTSANNIVFQDEGSLAGSNLQLGAATRTVTQNGTLSLMFNSTSGFWHEIGFA